MKSELIDSNDHPIKKQLWSAGVALVISLFVWSPLQAQLVTATINGIVKDSSGAVIPGATVILQNLDTGVKHATGGGLCSEDANRGGPGALSPACPGGGILEPLAESQAGTPAILCARLEEGPI